MSKSIEILCPARLTLFFNSYESNNIKRFKLINQTISLYDKLEISEDKKKYDGLKIISNKKDLTLNQNNICYKACSLFFEYTGINPNTFNVILEKGIPISKGLAGSESTAAGLLKGLNEYYHTNLTNDELMKLAIKLGDEVPYFLISGYAKITDDLTNIKRISNNPYNSYLVIEPNFTYTKKEREERLLTLPNKEVSKSDNHLLYSDYSRKILDELIELENFLKSCSNINYMVLGSGPTYFVASREKNMASTLKLKLKKEFPDYKIYNAKNVDGHKMLIKYPERCDI